MPESEQQCTHPRRPARQAVHRPAGPGLGPGGDSTGLRCVPDPYAGGRTVRITPVPRITLVPSPVKPGTLQRQRATAERKEIGGTVQAPPFAFPGHAATQSDGTLLTTSPYQPHERSWEPPRRALHVQLAARRSGSPRVEHAVAEFSADLAGSRRSFRPSTLSSRTGGFLEPALRVQYARGNVPYRCHVSTPSGSTACTPQTWFATWVTRRSTTVPARASAVGLSTE